MSLLASVKDERRGAVAIAHVEGEIDASNVWWVEERLRGPLTNECEVLVVDLTGTRYLDSGGIAMLFELAQALRQRQQQLRLVVAKGSSIARMVDLTGLMAEVPTHPSLDGALADRY